MSSQLFPTRLLFLSLNISELFEYVWSNCFIGTSASSNIWYCWMILGDLFLRIWGFLAFALNGSCAGVSSWYSSIQMKKIKRGWHNICYKGSRCFWLQSLSCEGNCWPASIARWLQFADWSEVMSREQLNWFPQEISTVATVQAKEIWTK